MTHKESRNNRIQEIHRRFKEFWQGGYSNTKFAMNGEIEKQAGLPARQANPVVR